MLQEQRKVTYKNWLPLDSLFSLFIFEYTIFTIAATDREILQLLYSI
jgi:hypothetical protein